MRYVHLELFDAIDELSDTHRAEISLELEDLVSETCFEKFRFGELVEFEQLNQGFERKRWFSFLGHAKYLLSWGWK